MVTVVFLVLQTPSSDAAEEATAISAGAWIPEEPYEDGQPLEPGIPLYQLLGYFIEEGYDVQWCADGTMFEKEPQMNGDFWWVYKVFDFGMRESPWLIDYLYVLSSIGGPLTFVEFYIDTVDKDDLTIDLVFELDWESLFISQIDFTFVPTRLMVDGEVFYTVAEVQEAYDSLSNLSEIPEPTKEGYRFTGWYEDPECTVPWDFMTMSDWMDLSGSIVETFPYLNRFIYAGWEPLESYITATSGSGTAEDPYSGTISQSNPWDWGYIPSDIYVEVGSSFDVALSSTSPSESFSVQDPLQIEDAGRMVYLRGDVESTGECELTLDGGIVTTFHFIQTYAELEFLSDPSDPLYASVSYRR